MTLRTRTPLQRRSPLRAKSAPGRTEKARKPPGDTGFSRAVKLAIRTRAGNGNPDNARCEACAIWLGLHGGQCQHLVARGMGGSRRPEINSVDAGVLLCGTPQTGDHGLCEARDARMHAMGFWRYSWEKPGPIMLHGENSGITVWLTADGGYSFKPPEPLPDGGDGHGGHRRAGPERGAAA